MKAQAGSERHALASNVAADCQHCSQRITAARDRIGTGREKVMEEIHPVIDVDQNVGQVGLWQSRLDQLFQSLYRVRLVQRLQGCKVKLAFLGIDGECV